MEKRKEKREKRKVKRVCDKYILGIALLIIASTLSGCDRIKEVYGKKEAGEAQGILDAPVYAVNTMLAVKGPIQDYIALSGDIIAGSTVDVLYSDAAVARVAQVYVAVGQRVNRGDRIAALDQSRPGMDYQLGIATAPISGTVAAVPAQVGMTISPAVPLARITGGNALEIRLYVAERFISRMARNLSCEITLDAWPGEIFQGSISEIAPTVDPSSRTMEVKVNVRDTRSRLKPGMFAKVKIITERKNNIVKIPSNAVVNRFGERYIFVVDYSDFKNPVARKRKIVQGILIDGILEVSEGLAVDEELVIRGMSLLEDGSKINIIDRLAPLGEN
ncbi:MAG: efflux RND transporter periplasmic adaptor subunit [Treponema sp.]|nr:efflux RND transporter periplasmic adaptor subunit [Treponema sp.]